MPEQRLVNQSLLRMSQETGIELVATNDVHYTYAEDEKPHDILLCLQTGKKLKDEDRCAMRAASTISNPKKRCGNFSPMRCRRSEYPEDRGPLSGGDRVRRDQAAKIRCAGGLYFLEYLKKTLL